MEKRLRFVDRMDFRNWLAANWEQTESVWLEFYKDGRRGISYQEALEEALCHGWIDSLIKKVDETVYLRKFSKRRKSSRWSQRNKALVTKLVRQGMVVRSGLDAVEEAKRNGLWNRKDEIGDLVNIRGLRLLLKKRIGDVTEFDALSNSLKRLYSMAYYSAKTEATKNKRLDAIIRYMKTKRRFM